MPSPFPNPRVHRVLATLQSIDPSWHQVLEAGGLVLMLPGNSEREVELAIRNLERDAAPAKKVC